MSDSKQVLNRQVIKNLIGNEPEMIKQFETDFIGQAKQTLQIIKLQFNSGQLFDVKEQAHFLKTSAKAVGAEQTAALLQELEECALDERKGECKQLIVNIFHSVQEVYKEMHK